VIELKPGTKLQYDKARRTIVVVPDDGVALVSISHPRPSLLRRLWFWLRARRDIRPGALETVEIEVDDPNKS
jgi:hypothetical protein